MNEFETKLQTMLAERADTFAVTPDEASVRQGVRHTAQASPSLVPSSVREHDRARKRLPWLVAAAAVALALVGAAVVLRSSDTGNNELAAGGLSIPVDFSSAQFGINADEAIIWLDPTATEADVVEIDGWLAEQPDLISYDYVDQAETFEEFREFWKDDPEVIEAVQPAQLPSSFRVVTASDPSAFARTVFHPVIRAVDIDGGTAYVGSGEQLGLLTVDETALSHLEVREGIYDPTLRDGLGHLPGSALPGQLGNAVIVGHRTTHGAPFRDLDTLHPGDLIVLETGTGPNTALFYEIIEQADGQGHLIVDANQTELLQSTDEAMLTLISSHREDADYQRIVVQARLVGDPIDTISPGLIELPLQLPPFD